jgi:hypothetical protein
MTLAFVLDVKVITLSNEGKSLGFAMIGTTIAGYLLIFFTFFQVDDLIIHLVFDGVVFFDKFAMAFDDFFTEIFVHLVEYDF